MNCSNIVFHQNKLGKTEKCTFQNAVHLTFGNVALLVTRHQLSELVSYTEMILKDEADIEDRDERCLYIPTRDHTLMFAMSYHEIKDLHEILEHTLLMWEVDEVLNHSL
jgi:hypothetical protein